MPKKSETSPKNISKDPITMNTDTSLHLGLLADKNKLKNTYNLDHQNDNLLQLNLSLSDSESDKKESAAKKSVSSSSSSSSSDSESDTKNKSDKDSSNYHHMAGKSFNDSNDNNTYDELSDREKRIKKLAVYNELMRLKHQYKVQLSKDFTMASDYHEMEEELTYQRNTKNREIGIDWSKKGLLGIIWAIEYFNGRYDPFGFQLDGWQEQMSLEVKNNPEYTDVIGEIYDKYVSTGRKMEPELKLLLLICGSAFGFHMTKQYAKNLPGLEDALKNDPTILGKLQSVISNTLNSGGNQQNEQAKMQEQLQRQYKEMQMMKQQMSMMTKQPPVNNLAQPFNNPIPRNNTNETITSQAIERQQLYEPKKMNGPPRDLLNKINAGNKPFNPLNSDSDSDRVVYSTTANSSDYENSAKSRGSIKKRQPKGPIISINTN